jgi:hypothetical protein
MYTADQRHCVIVAHVLSKGSGYLLVAMVTNAQLTMTCMLAGCPSAEVKDQ